MLFGAIVVIALLVAGWIAFGPRLVARRRRRVASLPFPPAWARILDERVPAAGRLPPALRRRLEQEMLVFLAEKDFHGCDGLAVTEEMRVTIAAQACLLLLGRPGHHFPRLRQVLVYPAPFVVRRERRNAIGLVEEHDRVHSGESWSHGQVVLSWPDALEGARDPGDGRNVVIHEFAHQLDQEKGHANGAPDIAGFRLQPRWSQVMAQEYGVLQERLRNAEPVLLDPYAATDPAEFFAVCSEAFFELPHHLAAWHPALFGELARLYRLDPRAWA